MSARMPFDVSNVESILSSPHELGKIRFGTSARRRRSEETRRHPSRGADEQPSRKVDSRRVPASRKPSRGQTSQQDREEAVDRRRLPLYGRSRGEIYPYLRIVLAGGGGGHPFGETFTEELKFRCLSLRLFDEDGAFIRAPSRVVSAEQSQLSLMHKECAA